MAITVTDAQISTFENTVRQLAQQNTTRLRKCVSEVNNQSEKHNWDRLAASSARAKTSPRMVSPAGGNGSGAVGSTDGLSWSRRSTVIAPYDTGEVIERENITQMLIDPKSASTESLVMNMGRQIDDIIIAAATGPANDGAGGTVALPAGQVVGDYSTEISVDFVLQVDEVFDSNDVDPDEAKFIVFGPKQKRKLMQLIEVTSGDYQDRKALSTGYMPSFLGYNWIHSNRLNLPAANQIDCFAFTKKALGLHIAGDISSTVAPRPDMSFAWQIYLDMQMAAVRVEDEHLVHMRLADTVV